MHQKIKILHVIKTLDLGGAEVNLLNMVEALDSEQIETFVAYSAGGELEPRFVHAGVKLFKFADDNHKLKSFASFGIISRLMLFILKNHIQIVHTHTFNAHVWGGLAAKLTGRKIVEHVHDSRYFDPLDFKRRRGESRQYKFIPYLKNFSDRVIVLTKQNMDYLIHNRLYPSNKVKEFQNGIPMEINYNEQKNRKISKEKFNIKDDALVILTPVRFSPEKNVDLILRIAPQVINECPQALFIIAGDGPLLEESKSKIRSLGLKGNVLLIGFEPDIKGLLGFTDIFLLPSFLELHSIAILEAMSMRVPVVISKDVGCNNEFISNERNGFLLDPFSDQGWAEVLIRLLKDEALRKRVGENGYLTCKEQFDIRNTVRNIEGIYHELAG